MSSVVEFSARLAPEMKLRGTQLRWFFKEALRDFLPPEVLTKEKHGFGLPVGAWLVSHRPLLDLATDSIHSLSRHRIVRPQFVDELLKYAAAGPPQVLRDHGVGADDARAVVRLPWPLKPGSGGSWNPLSLILQTQTTACASRRRFHASRAPYRKPTAVPWSKPRKLKAIRARRRGSPRGGYGRGKSAFADHLDMLSRIVLARHAIRIGEQCHWPPDQTFQLCLVRAYLML